MDRLPAFEDGVLGWSGAGVDEWILQRTLAGPRSVPLVVEALERRSRLREVGEARLRASAAASGMGAGLAAALLEDPAVAEALLRTGALAA